jgi:membrane protease YdiL (CAAX protease family)
VGAYPGSVPESGAAPLTPPRWGLGDAVIGLLLSFFGAVVGLSAVLALSGEKQDDLSIGWINIGQLGLWIPLVAVTWASGAYKGNGMVRDFKLRIQPVDFAIGPAVGVLSQWIVLPLLYLPIFWLTSADTHDLSKEARDLSDRAHGGVGVVLLVLLTGVGAPIVEELFYRGLLLRALQRRFGDVVAIVVSGVVFGLVHFQVLPTLGLAVFGMILATLVIKTDRLGPAVLAHMTFNMLAIIGLLATR